MIAAGATIGTLQATLPLEPLENRILLCHALGISRVGLITQSERALTEAEALAMHQGVIMTEALYATLVDWVQKYYRDQLEPKDLADPQLALECQGALEELARILGLPGLYDLT